jgi:hypothetical protein
MRKFIRIENKQVFNHKNEYLGEIEWMGAWKVHKQYVFAIDDLFFTASCLREIADHLDKVTETDKPKPTGDEVYTDSEFLG